MVLQDSIVPIERMVPPLKYCTKEELHNLAEQPMIPLNVEGDRQYLISLRHGLLVDKQRLFQILEGKFRTDSDRYDCKVDFDSQHNAHAWLGCYTPHCPSLCACKADIGGAFTCPAVTMQTAIIDHHMRPPQQRCIAHSFCNVHLT